MVITWNKILYSLFKSHEIVSWMQLIVCVYIYFFYVGEAVVVVWLVQAEVLNLFLKIISHKIQEIISCCPSPYENDRNKQCMLSNKQLKHSRSSVLIKRQVLLLHLAEWLVTLPGTFKCLIQCCSGLVRIASLFELGLLLEWSV